MFCSRCNAQLSDEAVYCPYCGAKVKAEDVANDSDYRANVENTDGGSNYVTDYGNYGDYNTNEGSSAQPEMPMKWYKFLIYFSLFAGAVGSIFSAVSYLTGLMYLSEDGTVIADLVYEVFPRLKTVDFVFALYYLAMAAVMVYTRFQLSGFKKRGPKLVTLVYVAGAVSYVVYVVMVAFAIEGSGIVDVTSIIDGASVGSTVVTSVVMAIINHIYFKKRAHLFVN